MNRARFALILKVAGAEMAAAISAGILAVLGLTSYYDYMASEAAAAPWVPAIYAFGPWPYVLAGLACAALAIIAIYKVRGLPQ